MQFQFKIQPYQTDAVNSVVNIFSGQPYQERVRYVRDLGISKNEKPQQINLFAESEIVTEDEIGRGFENARLQLSDEQLLLNIRNMQVRNNIKQSESLVKHMGRCSLDVEMETGTGKTYVYIKTMFELNKLYGWSKFIVVVPSIAIREGVKKSFEITQEHFMEYYGKKARFFIYNSKNLIELDNFSSNAGINVMIINVQAFNARGADARRIYENLDEFGSRKPIDVIKANRPIVILDEPQKMGGDKTQAALGEFNPLFCLNYSATHLQHHNLVYVLDALDAYNKRLVKKIEVKGFEVKNFRGTDKYLFLENIIISPKKPPMVKLELEIKYQKSINRETRILGVDDDLYEVSNNMEQYKGFLINEVDPVRGIVTFTNGESIARGEVVGDVSERDMRRIQIRETIISHFEKEKRNFELGIKTLSLFFIDEVAKYRIYDGEGHEINSEYGSIFEHEYLSILNDYITIEDTPYIRYLKEKCSNEAKVHAGYFSIDKKGRKIDSGVKRGSDESDDTSAYDLILRNKEQLLSFNEPVRFIFSHSALREGWDNPNVFQICTLKHSDSTTQKRQEVGRGLRLAVNQNGDRMDEQFCGASVHDINMLTVIASESYRQFVTDLQKKIREDLYDRPSKATQEFFIGKTIMFGEQPVVLDAKQAKDIYRYLLKNDYIDDEDNVTDIYRADQQNHCLASLPEALVLMTEGIHLLVQSVFDDSVLKDMITNGNQTKILENPLNDNFYKKEFQTLWGYINHQYAYTVQFDSSELVEKAVKHVNDKMFVTRLQYTVTVGRQTRDIDENAVERGDSFTGERSRTETLKNAQVSQIKYDLIGKIAEGATLTRRTTAAILAGLEKPIFAMFRYNPEEFISKAVRLIKEQKATMIVEHITYNRTEDCYDSSIFTSEKGGDFTKALRARKHIQDYVFTDGSAEKSIERKFAEDMERAEEVCVYAKLPKGFSIPTPVGNYSPDWAIAFNAGTVKHIFFIAETKGTMDSLNLRPIEQAKIACAKQLFNEISSENVKYHDIDSYQSLLNIMEKIQ
ncbi:type III restriction-modification system endonuclease [Paenibacillus sp. FSL H7-689]|uniref:type III restriction-modification system endonuclease n=1 Tax=Paenibacillus sp. FSL H7-689 TaxID=1227349 RepID=UPI0003E21867|nr:DEAD/DEAH box helicase family protein [Paenibacillus sp. FSL H7-689]ETT51575.1 type III restriction enzyme, res subunit [Paenibacillus sp. FSL H7-689]